MLFVSLVARVTTRAVEDPSTSSRIIQPKFEAVPETNAWTSAVTSHVTYPVEVFWQGEEPIVIWDVACALGGLLSEVPNGWLFQVIPVSVHEDPTRKMS